MKKSTVALLLLVMIASCSVVTVRVARLTPATSHVDITVKEVATTCTIDYPEKAHAEPGAFVHWAVKGAGDNCKNKKIRIANEPNVFTTCGPNPKPTSSPFLKCSDPEDLGDLTKEKHLYCRVDPFARRDCYKYSFKGDVGLDPEIEIERPRFHVYERIVEVLSRLLALFS
jgi:hypothetical protein